MNRSAVGALAVVGSSGIITLPFTCPPSRQAGIITLRPGLGREARVDPTGAGRAPAVSSAPRPHAVGHRARQSLCWVVHLSIQNSAAPGFPGRVPNSHRTALGTEPRSPATAQRPGITGAQLAATTIIGIVVVVLVLVLVVVAVVVVLVVVALLAVALLATVLQALVRTIGHPPARPTTASSPLAPPTLMARRTPRRDRPAARVRLISSKRS